MTMNASDRPRTARPEARLLVLDDDEAVLRLIERILRNAGFQNIAMESEPRKFLPLYRSFKPDILLLDLGMPHLDGLGVLQLAEARVAEGDYFPVLVITGDPSSDLKYKALSLGAKDFIAKPFDGAEVVLRIERQLETRELAQRLRAVAKEKTAALKENEAQFAERLALVAGRRDHPDDPDHTARVGQLAAETAKALGLTPAEVESYRLAAPLHDIGNVAVPDEILFRPGALTLEEMDTVKTHTTHGSELLSGGQSEIMKLAQEIAL